MSRITHAELLQLQRWNTPTIFNGWEVVSKHNPADGCFNREETRDFMPEMGPMVGYAVTVVCEPSNPDHVAANSNAWTEYREYVAGVPGPKIVVVQDLDKPEAVGSFWGEVNSNVHRALGCVGTITDGAIRDLDEIRNAGFKAIARRMCIGHAYVVPIRWNCDVEVFGTKVSSGQLVHADKHGFLAIPAEDEVGLLEASVFMDQNECSTVIAAARSSNGKSTAEIIAALGKADEESSKATRKKFGTKGEW